MENPFQPCLRNLGRCYHASIKNCEQVQHLKQDVSSGLKNIDQSLLNGKLKLWCLQFGLLPRIMWPLTVVDFPLTRVENMERVINSYVRKWLGVPRWLSNIVPCGHTILELPISSHIEDFKSTKTRPEMTLSESWAWEMLVDVGQRLTVPSHIVTTTLRPDLKLWSNTLHVLYIWGIDGTLGGCCW